MKALLVDWVNKFDDSNDYLQFDKLKLKFEFVKICNNVKRELKHIENIYIYELLIRT